RGAGCGVRVARCGVRVARCGVRVAGCGVWGKGQRAWGILHRAGRFEAAKTNVLRQSRLPDLFSGSAAAPAAWRRARRPSARL
ncbi:MAG: hypothetical protein, partial [Olavius algarvensis spirochete endosymbiont]